MPEQVKFPPTSTPTIISYSFLFNFVRTTPTMTVAEIINNIKNSDESRVKIAVADIDGILRGKMIHKKKFLDAVEYGFGFCDVIFGWDSSDRAYDNGKLTGWHTGYPDATARIDLSTYRTIPWDEHVPFFLADFSSEQNDLAACPRSLLKRIIRDLEKIGFQGLFAQEFEWFNFQETPDSLQEKGYENPIPATPGMFGYSILRTSYNAGFYHDLFVLLEQFGVPLEGVHTETGPGVYEGALQYASVLEAADRAVLFKTAVKEIAYKHQLMASFMAKWSHQLPGCSGHIHQSLWDGERNLFFDENRKGNISQLLESYIAGQLHCLPHILPMYAPTVNSYKRLVEGAWAPTTITWGVENRTTALRVINHYHKGMRLETRIPGADVNPYLAIAASLASGLYGIKKNLKLTVPPTVGNGYHDSKQGKLAPTLLEAIKKMAASELPGELFGEDFADHFLRTRDWEWRQYEQSGKMEDRTVTLWEMKRYFEII